MPGCPNLCYRIRPDDGPAERNRKRLLMPPMTVMGTLSLLFIIATIKVQSIAFSTGCFVFGGALLLTSGWTHVTGRFPRESVLFLVVGGSAGCFILDWANSRELGFGVWAGTVVFMDILLFTDFSHNVCRALVVAVMVQVASVGAEMAFRFGIFDWEVFDPEKLPVITCDCADPPCAGGASTVIGRVIVAGAVFIVDFWFTRGFASEMRQQMRNVQASVLVAERVALLLAGYETEKAQAVVTAQAETSGLPPRMIGALSQLLCNLEAYRPYLPDSLLGSGEPSGLDASDCTASLLEPLSPPSAPLGPRVCVCFTDIESSTALWEAHPGAMYQALNLHNAVVRSSAATHRGYEVKTIGDAFMLAFCNGHRACGFALEAQSRLVNQPWPAALLQQDAYAYAANEDGSPLWHGPRIRVGLHVGEVRVQGNPLTGRIDYFGPAVNVAARVESALRRGGLIGATRPVVDDCDFSQEEDFPVPPRTVSMGLRMLKGVRELTEIIVLLPQRLSARQSVIPMDDMDCTSPSADGGWSETSGSVDDDDSDWVPGGEMPVITTVESVSRTSTAACQRRSHNSPSRQRTSIASTVGGYHQEVGLGLFIPASYDSRSEASRRGSSRSRALPQPDHLIESLVTRRTDVSDEPAVSGFGRRESDKPERRESDRTERRESTSVSANTSKQSGFPGRPTRLRLLLSKSRVTLAHTRITVRSSPEQVEDAISHATVLVVQAADAAQGVVASVFSGSCVVAWNGPKPCSDPVSQCLHFVSKLRRPSNGAFLMHTGCCDGTALSGNVSAGRRRFATVVGGSVELAAALAEEAQLSKDRALATGAVAELCVLQHCGWLAGILEVSGSNQVFLTWEVCPPRKPVAKWAGFDHDRSMRADTAEVTRLLAALSRREDPSVLAELREFAESDQSLSRIVARVQTGLVRHRTIAKQLFLASQVKVPNSDPLTPANLTRAIQPTNSDPFMFHQ
eukprot:TRINITY_DN5913_c0_g1_i1.p1 TRINITY_DN5913_c0_g1~~TRINITY_DN5913_c0_g1_i1.p1  ORF type:complete len:981 (+),score=161.22 TRINITY_DN5913_c0_g1_i1:43-2943(+)